MARGLSNLPPLASTLLAQNLAPQISSLPLLTSGDDLDSNAPSRTLLPIRPTPTTPLNQRVAAAEKQAPSSELTLMVKKSEETEDASLRSEPSDVLLSSRNPAVAEVRPSFEESSLDSGVSRFNSEHQTQFDGKPQNLCSQAHACKVCAQKVTNLPSVAH